MISSLLIVLSLVSFTSWNVPVTSHPTDTGVRLVLEIPDGIHIQSNPASQKSYIPTTVTLKPNADVKVKRIIYPKAEVWQPEFSKEPIHVYSGTVEIVVELDGPPGIRHLEGSLRFQPCDEKACFIPNTTRFDFEVDLKEKVTKTKKANSNEKPQPANDAFSTVISDVEKSNDDKVEVLGFEFDEETRWSPLALLLIFLVGIALNGTPCVYPLIPVTVGFFGAQAADKLKNRDGESPSSNRITLVLIYCAALAFTFALLGLLAAVTGSFMGEMMTNGFVLACVSLVFILLAFWSFGLFEVRMDLGTGVFSKKGLLGAGLMGATAGLVAAPCIGPIVAGLFLIVADSQDYAWGFISFLILGAGISTPLGAMGFASGLVDKIPKPGEWMNWLKKLFGVFLLLAAIYPLIPVLGPDAAAMLASVLMIGSALALGVADRTKGSGLFRLVRGTAAVLIAATGLYFFYMDTGGSMEFRKFSIREFEETNAPKVVDVFATWCLPCLEMEKTVFSHEDVKATASDIVFFRIDITNEPPADIAAWLKARALVGVPTVMFYMPDNREVKQIRLEGNEPVDQFIQRLDILKREALSQKN